MGVCDVPVISTVCDSAGQAAATLASAPFDWLAQAMGAAAGWMFQSVWQVFDSTTFVDVASTEFTSVYDILFGVAVFLMLGLFLIQVIGAMIRREPAALARGALGLAKSVLGSFAALTLLAAVLEITDQLSIGIVRAAGTTMSQLGDRVTLLAAGLTGLSIAAPGASTIVTIFVAGLAIGAAVLVWISLLIRKTLLLLAIVFAPVALAGSSWEHTRGWVGRWASFVLALIVSKIVVVVILLLATAQIATPIETDLQSISQPISGVVLMLIAGFAPYLSYKAISFMGFDTYHAMSAEQEAKNALNRPLPLPLRGWGGAEPRSVLHEPGGPDGATAGSRTTAPATAPPGGSGTSGAAAYGAAGGATAAGLGAAAAGLAVKQATTAGTKFGEHLGTVTAEQLDAAREAQRGSSMPPSRTGDPAPASPVPNEER